MERHYLRAGRLRVTAGPRRGPDAWATAYGVYKVTYETGGYCFRTPEAWHAEGNFRASMYMRPQVIWAMQWALEHR
jgi:non-lysosomal glucosylceramidase